MNIAGPLALNAMLVMGDDLSTQQALRRPGLYEQGHQGVTAKTVQALCFTGADLIVQKKAPKLKWPLRIAVTVGHLVVIRHNIRKAQGR